LTQVPHLAEWSWLRKEPHVPGYVREIWGGDHSRGVIPGEEKGKVEGRGERGKEKTFFSRALAGVGGFTALLKFPGIVISPQLDRFSQDFAFLDCLCAYPFFGPSKRISVACRRDFNQPSQARRSQFPASLIFDFRPKIRIHRDS